MTNLPFDLGGEAEPLAIVLTIILATFASEDLTCIAVGLMIAAGRVDWVPGLSGCFVGIVLGDFGVWLAGRLSGMSAFHWQWVRRRLPDEQLAGLSAPTLQ